MTYNFNVCLQGLLLSLHYLRTGGLSNSPTWEKSTPWSQNVPLDAVVWGFHSCLLHAPALLFLLSAIYWPLLPLLTKHKINTTSTNISELRTYKWLCLINVVLFDGHWPKSPIGLWFCIFNSKVQCTMYFDCLLSLNNFKCELLFNFQFY